MKKSQGFFEICERSSELDSETGYYYYGARYYNPRVSLWLNVDPLAEKTMQPYAYANNNPVRCIDPDGKAPYDIVIRGSNNSSFTIKTSLVNSTINLSDYGISHNFGGNKSFNLGSLAPDAIGIDINGALSVPGFSGSLGVNLIWHTRGNDVWFKPEIHTYKSGALSSSADASVGASLGLVFAWAKNADGSRASNDYVSNGLNWTGTFWGASVAVGEGVVGVGGSYFTARDPNQNTTGTAWSGFSIAWTPQLSATGGTGKTGSIMKSLLNSVKTGKVGGSLSESYYYMNYGNGGDHLSNGKDITGWHIFNPIDAPKDDK